MLVGVSADFICGEKCAMKTVKQGRLKSSNKRQNLFPRISPPALFESVIIVKELGAICSQ